jgi:hypothetical protein
LIERLGQRAQVQYGSEAVRTDVNLWLARTATVTQVRVIYSACRGESLMGSDRAQDESA